jgi:hypothetical protein
MDSYYQKLSPNQKEHFTYGKRQDHHKVTPYGVFILRYLKSSNSTFTFFLYSSLSTLSQSILSLGMLSQVAVFFFGQAYSVVVTEK